MEENQKILVSEGRIKECFYLRNGPFGSRAGRKIDKTTFQSTKGWFLVLSRIQLPAEPIRAASNIGSFPFLGTIFPMSLMPHFLPAAIGPYALPVAWHPHPIAIISGAVIAVRIRVIHRRGRYNHRRTDNRRGKESKTKKDPCRSCTGSQKKY